MDCGPPDQLPPCFLNLNWEQSMEPNGHLESALSSIVSSSSSNSPAAAEGLVLRNLVGRMGSVGNAGEEISPQSHYMGTSLSSPPKLNLSVMGHLHHNSHGGGGLPVSGNLMAATHLDQFTADLGFAERAARFSSFDGRNYSGFPGSFRPPEAGKLSVVSSSQSPKASKSEMGLSESNRLLMPEGRQLEANDAEFGSAKEESSVSDPISASRDASLRGPVESSSKKRKAAPKSKGKDTTLSNSTTDPPKAAGEEDTNAKRCRSAGDNGAEKDANKPKVEQNGGVNTAGNGNQKQGKESNAKASEPLQDYIHVRARRGQATDSHSLAERVRREKISQRMKLLQDLVPGCNKVTGKAVMLDEIINYVQSLQRQVEFLSMKLATVNPQLDFSSVLNLLSKDIHQSCGPLPSSAYSLETSALLYANQPQPGTPLHCVVTSCQDIPCSGTLLDSTLSRTLSMQPPFLNGFGDASSQIGTFWEDDLQSVVQMNVGQNQENAVSSQSIHGPFHTAHMKIEL